MISTNPGRAEGGWRTRVAKPPYADSGQMLVSIITVVRNEEKHIEQTIRSVLTQTYPYIEYIVVDGESTDGTLAAIRKHEEHIAYWVSEPDRGIYDAMNKGISRATGDIVGIVNADDWYEPEAVSTAVRVLEESRADYCYGSIYIVDEAGAKVGITEPVADTELADKFRDEMPFGHPSVFIRKSVYMDDGLFDTAYDIAADYEFMLRIHMKGRRGVNLGQVVANFRIGGTSGRIASFQETREVAIAHGKSRLAAYASYTSSLIKLGLINVLPMPVINLVKRLRGSRHRNLAVK